MTAKSGNVYFRDGPHDGQIRLADGGAGEVIVLPDGARYRLTGELIARGRLTYPVAEFIDPIEE